MDKRPMDPKLSSKGALTHEEAELLLLLLLLWRHFWLPETLEGVLWALEIFFQSYIGLGSNFGVSAINTSLGSANITSATPIRS
jgi:hypothetical protein